MSTPLIRCGKLPRLDALRHTHGCYGLMGSSSFYADQQTSFVKEHGSVFDCPLLRAGQACRDGKVCKKLGGSYPDYASMCAHVAERLRSVRRSLKDNKLDDHVFPCVIYNCNERYNSRSTPHLTPATIHSSPTPATSDLTRATPFPRQSDRTPEPCRARRSRPCRGAAHKSRRGLRRTVHPPTIVHHFLSQVPAMMRREHCILPTCRRVELMTPPPSPTAPLPPSARRHFPERVRTRHQGDRLPRPSSAPPRTHSQRRLRAVRVTDGSMDVLRIFRA